MIIYCRYSTINPQKVNDFNKTPPFYNDGVSSAISLFGRDAGKVVIKISFYQHNRSSLFS